MNRFFGLLMLGVGIVFIALALLAPDPDCKEGPCTDDFVVFLGFMVEAVIAVHWVVFAIAVSWTSRKDSRSNDGR